ncbi:MAG: HD domain-containing phosphohydrolase [Thermoanaerobaculia bacterium]
MRFRRAALEGRLARRMLALVLLASWLPLAILAWTSLSEYQARMSAEADSRLAELAKASGLELFRRLESMRADLEVLAPQLEVDSGSVDLLAMRAGWRDRFVSLWAVSGDPAPAGGGELPPLDELSRQRLRERHEAVLVESSSEDRPAIWLVIPGSGSSEVTIWARARIERLWPESEDVVQEGAAWLLFGQDRKRPIATSQDVPAGLFEALEGRRQAARDGFRWSGPGGEPQLAHYWTTPLRYDFGYPGMTVLVTEPYRVGSAVRALRRILLLVSLASLLLIALIGIRRLRSDLGPLEELTVGAHLIEQGDLKTRVSVRGGAEVGRLSEAFNRMAQRLEQHFYQADGIQGIAASALTSSPTVEGVAQVFVDRVVPIVGDREVVLVLADDDPDARPAIFRPQGRPDRAPGELERTLPDFSRIPADGWIAGPSESVWRALRRGERTLAFVGVLAAGGGAAVDRAALLDGACAQAALALSRVRLLEDLERANWGALTALARAVDEKSSWTHGHSIRVAEIATSIAHHCGFPEEVVRRIRRGSLVHDVGKIGVPSAVLEKRGGLSEAEMAIMRSHVEKGARILEPVEGLKDLMRIVWQHHERLDGSGYPHRLRRGEIDTEAALVAVADVYEALTAARPYRPARSPEIVERHLRGLAGIQFEARFVEALCEIRERHDSWITAPGSAVGS